MFCGAFQEFLKEILPLLPRTFIEPYRFAGSCKLAFKTDKEKQFFFPSDSPKNSDDTNRDDFWPGAPGWQESTP